MIIDIVIETVSKYDSYITNIDSIRDSLLELRENDPCSYLLYLEYIDNIISILSIYVDAKEPVNETSSNNKVFDFYVNHVPEQTQNSLNEFISYEDDSEDDFNEDQEFNENILSEFVAPDDFEDNIYGDLVELEQDMESSSEFLAPDDSEDDIEPDLEEGEDASGFVAPDEGEDDFEIPDNEEEDVEDNSIDQFIATGEDDFPDLQNFKFDEEHEDRDDIIDVSEFSSDIDFPDFELNNMQKAGVFKDDLSNTVMNTLQKLGDNMVNLLNRVKKTDKI